MFPRKPALPAFWRSSQWNEWLPPPSNNVEHEGLPRLPEFAKARAIIAALDPHEVNAPPVPLADARAAASALDTWFDTVGSTLTWPPTVEGFVAAAKPLFERDAQPQDRFVLGLLDAFRPDLVSAARLEIDLRETWMAGPAPTVSATGTSINPSALAEDKGPLSAMAKDLTEWVAGLNAQSDMPLSLLQEDLDGKIKASVLTSKGAGTRSKNYWFEDILFPALCELSLEDLTALKKYWPPHQECSFNDPVKAIESRPFWQGLRNMQTPARKFLMEELLPAIVNSETWQPAQRLAMLQPMLSRIKEHPGLIRERLALWQAWGGDVDMVVYLPVEEGALSAPQTTAKQWMAENSIDPNATSTPRPRPRRPR